MTGSLARETRDATHVQYYSKKSYWRWSGAVTNVPNDVLGFGCAELFLVIDADFLRALCELNRVPTPPDKPVVLAIVSPIPYLRLLCAEGLVQYRLNAGKYAKPQVIDAMDIDCLVRHVTTALKESFIVERETVVRHMDMLDSTVNPD
ncbi:hypothetical protein FRC06_000789 [Ceratobasidium sp. 370]|nr:hypothetical protein FRC06_000789 [Ceratobasidium sp. 370]